MAIYRGSSKVKDIFYGNQRVNFVYKGSSMVYGVFQDSTFEPSTDLQEWVVPRGVSKIHVDCVASQGYTENSRVGGKGGRVECDLSVTGGQTLYMMVGSLPTNKYTAVYNASDIRLGGKELNNRIIVAGGGGSGNSSNGGGNGGAGGGLTGANGDGVGYQTQATGGTQTEGGKASARSGGNTDGWLSGANGTFGLGGNGADGYMYGAKQYGGSGGAGWYGGGGGSVYDINKVGVTYAPGGGGSSYTNATYCTNVKHTQGYQEGNGYIKITMA